MKTLMLSEQRRQTEQTRLDSLKSSAERNELGQYATPPQLAADIVRHLKSIWDGKVVRFLDPAVGTGSFYSALVSVFDKAAIREAVGIDIDPSFANTASKLWKEHGLTVRTGDFTHQKAPVERDRFNMVLTNPPYVRHHHLEPEEKIRLKGLAGKLRNRSVSGLAGLYVYFLLLAHEWMSEDGLACWLVPSEFMDVNYGHAVREYLTHDVSLVQIHRFSADDVQFGDALVTSAIVIFRNKVPTPGTHVIFSFGGGISVPQIQQSVSLSVLRSSSKWTGYPHRSAIGTRTKPTSVTLGELFSIKRGLATGSNDFFILPRHVARARGIPPEAMKPILPSPRQIKTPVIERSADGWPMLDEPLCLIDSQLSGEQIERRFPRLWEYLERGRRENLHKGYLASRRVPWYSQERRPPAPFLCTYMGRRTNGLKPFRFLWNKSQATAANVYLLLYPKPRLQQLLDDDESLAQRVFEALQRIDIANFLGEGRVYGGGLHKIEPKELAALDATSIVDSVGNREVSSQLNFSFAGIA